MVSIMESLYRDFLDSEQLDIIEVLENKNVREDKFTGMRRISPVQFLRDRELGMHGTNERIFKQRVTMDSEPVCSWPYHAKQRVYKWMLDECKIEEGEECRIQRYEYRDIYYWMEEIFKKIHYWSDRERESVYRQMQDACKIEEEECKIQRYEYRDIYYWSEKIIKKTIYRSEFIASPAGIGRYIELIVMNDFNYRCYYYGDEPHNFAFEELDDDYFDLYENYKGVSVNYNNLRTDYLHVQSIIRHCELCKQVTCKCSVEKRNVI